MERSRKYRQVLAASFANLTILVSGIALSWTSPIESMLKDPKLTPLGEPVTDAQFAWISSLAALGAACGPFMAVGMTERLGRRWSILVASVPMLLGWVLVAAAQNVAMIYVARIFWGIAVGIAFMVTPMYVGEIAETEIRGALGSFMQIFVVTGNLIIYSVGSFLSYAMISVLGIASTALAAICFFFMPESPIHCVNKGNRKAASASLQFLRGKSEQGVELELQTLEAETKLTRQQEGGLKEIFTSKGNFKALYISCILMAVQQFSGINVVLFNMQGIFSKAGAGVDPSLAAIIIGAVQVLSSCITPFVVDRLGRRILLLISSVGMTIGLGLLGLFFFFDDRGNPVVEFISWLPVASLVLYMIVYNTGYGPVPWTIMGEMFATNIKSKGALFTTAFSWLMAFLITRFFSDIEAAIGIYSAFWMFCIFCIFGFIFVMFYVPETKGRSLQEIQDILNIRKSSK